MDRQRIIIVGASSGIGAALAKAYLDEGHSVALIARSIDKLRALASEGSPGQAHIFVHDVTQTHEVPALFQSVTEALGGLDLVIYSSGVLSSVAIDEFSTGKDIAMIDVNVTGGVAWLNEAANRFQHVGHGQLVGLSSVAGERGRKPSPVYGASKAFFSTYLESLASRLWKQGIAVTCLKPGFIRTPMIEHLGKLPFQITVEEAAKQMMRVIRRRRRVAYIPGIWRWVSLALRLMPHFVMKRLKF